MSTNTISPSVSPVHFQTSVNPTQTESNDLFPMLEALTQSSTTLNPDRVRSLNQIIKKKLNHLRSLVDNFEFEPNPADPLQQEKSNRRDKCLVPVACVPGVGTGISVFKELDLREKLKNAVDDKEKAILLKKQKDFRVSALIRTIISVALAILIIGIGILGTSVSLGLTLMGAALAVGSGFIGLYAGLLHDSNKKIRAMKSLGQIEEVPVNREEQPVS